MAVRGRGGPVKAVVALLHARIAELDAPDHTAVLAMPDGFKAELESDESAAERFSQQVANATGATVERVESDFVVGGTKAQTEAGCLYVAHLHAAAATAAAAAAAAAASLAGDLAAGGPGSPTDGGIGVPGIGSSAVSSPNRPGASGLMSHLVAAAGLGVQIPETAELIMEVCLRRLFLVHISHGFPSLYTVRPSHAMRCVLLLVPSAYRC